MNCLLVGGAQSVGKSESIYRLALYLQKVKGFKVVNGSIPVKFSDFKVVLSGNNNAAQPIKIILNSATDTTDIIYAFKAFYDKYLPYNILVSSIRDDDFYPRNEFFKIMNINSIDNFILELPLAKITRRGNNFIKAFTWYKNKIDLLVQNILAKNPFDI